MIFNKNKNIILILQIGKKIMSTIRLKFFLASKFFTVIFQNINIETSHSIGVEK